MAKKEQVDQKIKNNGRIYTPCFIVKNILDLSGYKNNILTKNIIDNSCGDGAFLIEIVKRYCEVFIKKYGKNKSQLLKNHLEKYIHGIEIEKKEHQKCLARLNLYVKDFGLTDINWDIICADTLSTTKYNGQMDYVVGNPPYVRVHNLAENYINVKKFQFCEKGMTDLYIVFFEIGLNMLNSNGKMCLITPSSCLRSKAGNNFRKFILKNRNLNKIVDLEHFQPFNATAYTMITLFENNNQNDYVDYYVYDKEKQKPEFVEKLNYSDVFVNDGIFVSKKQNLNLLHEVENYTRNILKKIVVKNGLATLGDSIFIGNFDFKDLTIDVLKASNGKWFKCLFPYDKNGSPLDLAEIKKHKEVFNYMLKNKDFLEKRSLDKKGKWYLFGRTQALNDVFKEKIAINTIVKDVKSIKLELVPANKGVYSGLYILTDFSFDEIKNVIKSDEFIQYIKILKNYKSGGYYSFSSKDLQKFLTFKLRNKNYEQQSIFAVDC